MSDNYVSEFTPTFGRADLRPDIFDQLVSQKGFTVVWEQAMFCSCLNLTSGQPDYNCPVCHGKGYAYMPPKTTKVIATSINGRKDQERIGLNEQGTAYITSRNEDLIGFRDRFTFVDFQVKTTEVLVRGTEPIDKCRYKVLDALYIQHLGEFYKKGIDFIMHSTGIEWVNPSMVHGMQYSILYKTNPVYVALSPIHELRGSYSMRKGQGAEYFVQLPCQYMVKREDFITETGQDGY
jgi:hypothetical protein